MYKKKLNKCEYCGKEYKVLDRHYKWCKAKIKADIVEQNIWAPTPINWHERYLELDSKYKELLEKNRKLNLAYIDTKEAMAKLAQAVFSIMGL